MNTDATATTSSPVVPMILGLAAALLIASRLANVRLPLINNDRAALIVLLVIGMALCGSAGIGRSLALYGWMHPVTITGIVLGILILTIAALALLGVQMPVITSERAAFTAIAGIALLKVVVMGVGRLLS